jgi:hypothetical protein
MKKLPIIAAILFSCFIFAGCDVMVTNQKEVKKAVYKIAETAYFEGQRDALTGDIRIKRDEENYCWRATKTFWDDGTPLSIDVSGIPDKK